MSTTLTTLLPLVRHRLGLAADDGMLPDASLTITLNKAIAKMAIEFDWPWLIKHETITTVDGTNEYSPPAGWVKTMWIVADSGGYEIKSRQRVDLVNPTTYKGTPQFFAVNEQKIYLSPTPDSVLTYTHSYMSTDNTLASGSDTVLCPDHYVDIIVVYAAIIESRRLHDSALEAQLMQDKKEWMKNIAKLIPQVDILPRIKVGRYWPTGH